MRETTIGSFLNLLAARTPTPGGGASAALQAAQAAALLEMVARYSDSSRYDEHREELDGAITTCHQLRDEALALADDELAVFEPIAAGLAMPKTSEAEREARTRALSDALIAAARPPLALLEVCEQIVAVAELLERVGSRSLISDVACAAETVRSATAVARLNVVVNTRNVQDASVCEELNQQAAQADSIKQRADAVSHAVYSKLLSAL